MLNTWEDFRQQAILELAHSSSEKTNIQSLWSSFKAWTLPSHQFFRTVYYNLVFSHLQCAMSSWGSASTYLLKTIQNKIIRLITFSSYISNA